MGERTFGNTAQEMLMAELRCALTQSNHTRLHTHSLQLRAIELICTPCKFLIVDVGRNSHLP